MIRTALVRVKATGNLKTIQSDEYTSQKDFATDLRGNGYRVLKIWNCAMTDEMADEWEFLNRK